MCGRFPYMASLRNRFNIHKCNGVLVDSQWVLTVAHCVDINANVIQRPFVVIGACNLDDEENENGVVEVGQSELLCSIIPHNQQVQE